MSSEVESKEAVHGEKMIEVKIRFWTNNIAETKGHILPKHGWPSGMVIVPANKSHGISAKDPIPFNSLMEISSVLEQVLIESGITVHPGGKMKSYLSQDSES